MLLKTYMIPIFHLKRLQLRKGKVLNYGLLTKLKKRCKKKNRLYKKYLSKPSLERERNFKTYWNKLNKDIRYVKKEYYLNKFQSVRGNMQKTWKYINEIIRRKPQGVRPEFILMKVTKFMTI